MLSLSASVHATQVPRQIRRHLSAARPGRRRDLRDKSREQLRRCWASQMSANITARPLAAKPPSASQESPGPARARGRRTMRPRPAEFNLLPNKKRILPQPDGSCLSQMSHVVHILVIRRKSSHPRKRKKKTFRYQLSSAVDVRSPQKTCTVYGISGSFKSAKHCGEDYGAPAMLVKTRSNRKCYLTDNANIRALRPLHSRSRGIIPREGCGC
ncbi:hypothetical protein NDU88_004375 [Pleurodeles waltl]|uniref:Uncharacterized protein n=1 Tax=Pleurodeles waltl TaxID=8319 RepID=A0AAV7L6J7_PLEWA|nr:hypothetical protein NDU88_004375 [Pleurodeles waltl]